MKGQTHIILFHFIALELNLVVYAVMLNLVIAKVV